MPGDVPDISVIIVSFNTRQMTLDCLRALHDDIGSLKVETIVLENGSTDGTAAAIREAWPEVRLIESPVNVGFGAGNNLAMREATGKYLLLLNTDAFVRPGTLRTLMSYLQEHPELAVVGPRLLNRDGSLQRSCWRFPSPWRAWADSFWITGVFGSEHRLGDYRRWNHDVEREVDWVVGACLLLRREVYEQVGGFDERFFMYAEETDWQHRMRKVGWRIAFTPRAEVVHLGGGSGAAEAIKTRRSFFRSNDQYELKHYGMAGLVMARLGSAVGCAMRIVAWSGWLVVRPGKRAWLRNKMSFAWWLLVRQMTDWRFSAD